MSFVVLLYVLLLIIFFIISGLVIRHTLKFGSLNPAFKVVVLIFSVLALILIIYSLYLLISLGSASHEGSTPVIPNVPRSSGTDLNF